MPSFGPPPPGSAAARLRLEVEEAVGGDAVLDARDLGERWPPAHRDEHVVRAQRPRGAAVVERDGHGARARERRRPLDARAEKDARKPREDGREETATPEAPRFSSAPTPASFARLPLPPGEDQGDHRDGRYPALSMDGGRFLAHVRRACARRSPKMAALVADLREAFKRLSLIHI